LRPNTEGARDQVYKQLKNKEIEGMDDKAKFLASGYLVSCTFTCLDEMFNGAQAIKTWLSDSAQAIAQSGAPVTWVTPMGMPVVQPYHKKTQHRIQAGSHKLLLTNTAEVKEPPDPNKQRSAFPPNYVHSLDSTHMMYTANACGTDDVTFVAVHDSYWTHASTVDTMNVHCREQFVRLHSQPLLGRLSEYFELYFQGAELKTGGGRRSGQGGVGPGVVDIAPPPERGDFDLQEVIKSPYFFN
jgi:DNA-directed RNA polymerase